MQAKRAKRATFRELLTIIWKGAVCCVWRATLLIETRAKRVTYSFTLDMAFPSRTWEGAVHCGRQSILLGHFLLALLAFWYYINRQQDFWCTTFHAWIEQCLEIRNLWILWMKGGLIRGLWKVSLQFACVDRLIKEYTKFHRWSTMTRVFLVGEASWS